MLPWPYSRHAATSGFVRTSGSAPAGEHAADPTCGQGQHHARHLRHLRRQGLRLGGSERGRALRRGVDAVTVDVEHGVGQLLVVEQQRGEALGAWWRVRVEGEGEGEGWG